ncbi:SGNH/GDSL hydrolase family protein [Cytophaga sp. FL35]|uniref:SGNH/GDSL hydrolase family protein n=1 Tax=Cytophaga sp. FL35 TaxID=1904456 RepID=UPI001653B8F0|nr:SGNH/GDSL hydrolase family protein [Cytophaga sp. FL35]MBC6997709.1 G-D-S-L family lipolytic protein [Cytophaga sp. FL35]
MMKIRYIALWAVSCLFIACNEESDFEEVEMVEEMPELTSGTADFSTYVSLGNSLTAGLTDNALFIAGQQNSMPNLLAAKFSLVGGGSFTQPLANDNIGGLLAGGVPLEGFKPRLVFGGAGPKDLEEVVGPVSPTTDIALNNPSGPFNNLGVPGAKSFHMLFNGYGNLGNLEAKLANPYFVRMTGSTPDVSILELAMAQSPTFFTLWAGNNDVLGYAISGGDDSNPITEQALFDNAINGLVGTLTSAGAQGVMANIPYVTTIPHFTTVPHNPLDPTNPDFAAQIPTLNTIFGTLNQIYTALGETERLVVFSETEASAVVIFDEDLADVSAQIAGALNANPGFPLFVQQFGLPSEAAPLVANLLGITYGQTRQATEEDLFVLPSSNVIGEVNEDSVASLMAQGLPLAIAGQFSVEGISLPLADKWVLTPEEQDELKTATDNFNATIAAAASGAGLAFVDANAIMQNLANGGVTDGDYTLTANLVTGGAFSLDGVHPTARGYALLANEFMKAIDATYGSNFEDSGSLYDIGNFPTNYSPTLR